MKRIAVISGKGGVGKSSIAASLAVALSSNYSVICADCDVDASNLALVLGIRELKGREKLRTSRRARIITDKCTRCRKCYDNCMFDAIRWEGDYPFVDKYLCEGCNTCSIVCPENAVELLDVENAEIGHADTKYGFKVVSAQLKTGESGSGKVVAHVKAKAQSLGNGADIMVIDAAAGIGCPVIASVTGSDEIVAVAEPTPTGFSDLKRALEMVGHFRIPCSIVINKSDINQGFTRKIEQFAKKSGIGLLAKIPYDRSFVKALVALRPVIDFDPKYRPVFEDMALSVMEGAS